MLIHLREVANLALQIRAEFQALDDSSLHDIPAEELYACGFLHDCIEDTQADWEDVAEAAGERVADWVARLSLDKRRRRPRRDQEYERQIRTAQLAVRIVKLADLLSNLRGIRGSPEESPWIARYIGVAERQLPLIADGLDGCRSFIETRDLVLSWRTKLASAT